MTCAGTSLVLLVLTAAEPAADPAGQWRQFRGPNAAGVAAESASPPVEFGPERNLLWKAPLPPGVSSPSVWGDRIFLTAFAKEGNKLETLCLDRGTGEVLWRRDAPAPEIERTHETSSPASGTPAADAERVAVYFGSFGLLCYDYDGNELWRLPTPLPRRRFGSGTSPVLAGDIVLLNRDEQPEPQLLAVDARTGEVRWRQAHAAGFGPGGEGYATPVVADGLAILHRPDGVAAYDLKDGARRWWVSAMTSACSTPVVADGTVYVATWNNFGEPDLRADLPLFDDLAKKHDADADGLLSKDEFPADLAVSRRPGAGPAGGGELLAVRFFDGIDLNHDAKVSGLEWAAAATMVAVMSSQSEHGLIAVTAGGEGDRTGSVVWREKRYVPEVPSPLVYRGRVYAVKDGGIVTCLDAATGKPFFRKRLGAAGSYYASPVAAAGRIYAASREGVVTVLAVGDKFEVLARNDLAEPISATPAIVGNAIYVRTEGALYAFGEP